MMHRRPAFIAYFTAGDGGMDYSLEAALALEKGGVDLLEIGIPFSDPVADGPVIQKAMQRSLELGTKPEDVLELIRRIRKKSKIPIVLFSYYNPILQGGKEFLHKAKEVGADGILIVDLSIEEQKQELKVLDQIWLVSATTSPERMAKILPECRGFVYYACQKGTTGARRNLPEGFGAKIQQIKAQTQLPVVAGFGIASRESAAEALLYADGFVVGSLIVDAMGRKVSAEELTKLAMSVDPRRSL